MSKRLLFTVFATALAAMPEAMACTACFGQSDSRMAQGMNMGILALLLVITCVLCGVAGFFVFVARRSEFLENGQGPASGENFQHSSNV